MLDLIYFLLQLHTKLRKEYCHLQLMFRDCKLELIYIWQFCLLPTLFDNQLLSY